MPLIRDVIPDPPAAILQGVDVALFGLEELTVGWSADIIMSGPSIEMPVPLAAPQNSVLLPVAKVQTTTYPMVETGGGVFVIPIAVQPRPSPAVESAQALLISGQTIDNDGLGEIVPSVPEPNFGEVIVPAGDDGNGIQVKNSPINIPGNFSAITSQKLKLQFPALALRLIGLTRIRRFILSVRLRLERARLCQIVLCFCFGLPGSAMRSFHSGRLWRIKSYQMGVGISPSRPQTRIIR